MCSVSEECDVDGGYAGCGKKKQKEKHIWGTQQFEEEAGSRENYLRVGRKQSKEIQDVKL